MPNLVPGTYPAFMNGYLRLAAAGTIAEAVEKYSSGISAFFKNIPAEKIDFRYAPDKWNIKEMLQHIIDTERIFAYRLTNCKARQNPFAWFR